MHVWTRRLLQASFDDEKWSARMHPACLVGEYRGTPAASMRSSHPVLSKLPVWNNPAGTTVQVLRVLV